MALKFLNKKGWHTGSLRNIENVWKAEQKHDAEQKKLEELKKQIKEEREAQEFRALQEQAGFAPKQERLDFLYDSGLAVGKTATTDEYLLGKPVEEAKESELAKAAEGPGALFVSKPQSANDAWRKLHSDPLLLIRQQEQAALAAIRSNPVKMDMIRKEVLERSVEKDKKRKHKHKHKHKHKEAKKKVKLNDHSEESDSGEEHKGNKPSRRLKGEESGSISSEEHRVPSKRRRSSDKKSGPSPEISRDDRERYEGYGIMRDGSLERKHHSGRHNVSDRRDDRSLERGRDSRRLHNGERRTGEGSDRRHVYDRHQSGYAYDKRPGNSYSDDIHDKTRWREDHSRRRRPSPNWDEDTARYDKSEKRTGRGTERGLDGRTHNDGKGRRQESLERHDFHERREAGSGRNEEKGSSAARHVRANSPGRKDPNASQQNLVRGETEKKTEENPVHRQSKVKLSEEEKVARLKEMQIDAELHEEQRWQRLKKGAEADAKDVEQSNFGRGKSFMDDTNKSVYGAQNTTNASLSESVRRRAHYRDRGAADGQSNAFRR